MAEFRVGDLLTRVKRLLYAIEMPRKTRDVFYRVIEVQLRSGLALEPATLNAYEALGKRNTLAKRLGKRLQERGMTGVSLTDDWKRTGYLPLLDGELMALGERRGTLPDTLGNLCALEERPMTFFANVIKPNFYSIFVTLFALTFLFNFSGFLEMIAGRYPEVLDQQISYRMSLFLQTYWLPAVVLLGCLALTLKLLNEYATGKPREKLRGILVFYDTNFAIEFLRVARRFAEEGSSFVETVRNSLLVFRSPHVSRTLRQVEVELMRGGNFLQIIQGRIVPSNVAGVVEALAPSNERALLPRAYETGEIILMEYLKTVFATAETLLKAITMFGSAIIIGMMAWGMYATAMDMTDAVTNMRR